jgi:hypothetical protein
VTRAQIPSLFPFWLSSSVIAICLDGNVIG